MLKMIFLGGFETSKILTLTSHDMSGHAENLQSIFFFQK